MEDGDTDAIYSTGCVSKLYADLEENAALVGGIGGGLVLIQLVICIIAFTLGCRMRK